MWPTTENQPALFWKHTPPPEKAYPVCEKDVPLENGGTENSDEKMRAQLGWKKISRELGVGVSTVLRITQEAGKSGSENSKPQTFRTTVRKTRFDSASGIAVAVAFH
jgi:hypothetical protein